MRNANHVLHPLKLVALPKEKVWGGNRIAKLFPREGLEGQSIGELWVVWDQLAVENGALQGKKLAELVREHPISLLGSRLGTGASPVFPLLVKILDAQETLSVQVHPDDAYAREHEGEPFGKAEVWYILEAEPQYQLIRGVKRPVSRAEAREAIEKGTLQELLDHVPVTPGDVIMNGPGTIHALRGGVLLYELQQSSDLTYRLYDWDRRDPARPLHIEKSLDVANLEPFGSHKVQPIEIPEAGGTRKLLCACEQFAAELLTVNSYLAERPSGTCFHILTILGGTGYIRHGAQPVMDVQLHAGDSLLVPASIYEYELCAATEDDALLLIKAYVPDLLQDIVRPLRERGVPGAAILQLGGDPRSSELGRHQGQALRFS